jgi:hypothetical protein
VWFVSLTNIAAAGVRAAQYIHIDQATGVVTLHQVVANAGAIAAALAAGELLKLDPSSAQVALASGDRAWAGSSPAPRIPALPPAAPAGPRLVP